MRKRRLQGLLKSLYMLLAQARVCHVRTCAQYSLVEANARWRLEMSCH